MNKKITLLCLMMVVVSLAIGQIIVQKNDSYTTASVEQHLKSSSLKYSEKQNATFLSEYSTFENIIYTEEQNLQLLVDSMIAFNWDTVGKQFEPSWKTMYEFDSDGQKVLSVSSKWINSNSTWDDNSKYEYIYDSLGNEMLVTAYLKNEDLEWVYYWKNETLYDTKMQQQQINTFEFDTVSNEWFIYRKSEKKFDAKGNMLQQIDHFWNKSSSNWYNQHKFEFAYNENNKRILYSSYTWSEISMQWQADSKTVFSYDDNENQNASFSYRMDNESLKWIEHYKDTTIYDDFGFRDISLAYHWDDNQSVWNGSVINDWDFNSKGEITNQIAYRWDREDSDWNSAPFSKLCYYYMGQDYSANKEFKVHDILVYPNPFVDYISIKLSNEKALGTFELYDNTGHKILFKEVKSGNQIQMNGLSRGIYHYTLNVGGELHSGSLRKE